MRPFNDMFEKQMKDDEFRKEYESIEPEMDEIGAIVKAMASQNLTQKEPAERTGINSKNPKLNQKPIA